MRKNTPNPAECVTNEQEAWEELYFAIWSRAVMDSVLKVKASIVHELKNRMVSKADIHRFIAEHKKLIERTCQENVFKEEQAYPNNPIKNELVWTLKLRNKLVNMYFGG